jgi:hypothetical protein
MTKLFFAGLLSLVFAHSASATTVFGVDASSDSLHAVTLENGTSRIIGPLDPDRTSENKNNRAAAPVALAVRPSDNAIFVWNNGGVGEKPREQVETWLGLLRVDGKTGQATYVGGSGQGGALAFGPNEVLYRFDSGLAQVDTITGAVTEIGRLRATNGEYLVAHGAAWEGKNGVMFVSAYSGPSGDPAVRAAFIHSVYTVDLATGVLTLVGPIGLKPGVVIGDLVYVPKKGIFGTAFAGRQTMIFRFDQRTRKTQIIASPVSMSGVQGLGFATLR